MNTHSEMLISNGTATGGAVKWPGGRGVFMVGATWNGATISLHVKLPNGTFIAVNSNTTLTADGLGGFDLPPCDLKAVVSVATPAAVYASVARVPA